MSWRPRCAAAGWACRTGPAQGVRSGRRGVGRAGRSRRGRSHRRGGRARPVRAAAVRGHVPGTGGAEPAGCPVLEGRRSRTGGRPPPPPGSPRFPPRHWITGGSGTRCTPSPSDQLAEISRRVAVRIVQATGVDVSSVALDMTNFATFIDYRQRQGTRRAAGQGQAETRRPAAGRAGPGGHPRRRDPADLARLPRQPARRHPVPRHDRSSCAAGTRRSAPRPASRRATRRT